MTSAWVVIHTFWGWGVGGFAALATLADAIKGFKWSKTIFGAWVGKMFGLTAFRNEMREELERSNKLMETIAKEMKPNGGSSLRDVINKVADRVDQIDTRQILQYERVKALSMDSVSGVQEFNPEGELVWCNRTYLRLVDRDLSEVSGYGWLNSVHPEDRDKVKEDWQDSVHQEMAYESSYRILTPDGETIRIAVRSTVMRGSGTVIGYVTTVSQVK